MCRILNCAPRSLILALTAAYISACSIKQNSALTDRAAETRPSKDGALLLVGTFSENTNKDLHTLKLDPNTNTLIANSLDIELDNVSYGVSNTNRSRFYLTSFDKDRNGLITTIERDNNGEFTVLDSVPSGGKTPCYVSISPDGDYLAVAHYQSGTITVFRIGENGVATEKTDSIERTGRSQNVQRQSSAHPHWVGWSPDASFLYAVDLGTDEILAYPLDSSPDQALNLLGRTAYRAKAGDGPRHMVFHPTRDNVYIINELSNDIVVAQQNDDGGLSMMQRIALPSTSSSLSSHIEVGSNGRFLYAAVRGQNSISVFEIMQTGKLKKIQDMDSQGNWPRHFMLLQDPKLLLVSHQKSNNIHALEIDPDGKLATTGIKVELPSPVFMMAIE